MLLKDRHGRTHNYLRISVTDKCNLRCGYCMPAEGFATVPNKELLSDTEILQLCQFLAAQGLQKIRLTGGEPLLRQGLPDLIHELKSIPGIREIGLTTNGILLDKYAPALRQAGLDTINISLDTLCAQKFARITRRTGWQNVRDGIDLAVQLQFPQVKVNAVALAGVNEDELCDLARLAENQPIQVRFIETMPFKGNGWTESTLIPYEKIVQLLGTQFELIPLIDPNQSHPISQSFAVPGFQGTLGVIASMTQSFCAGCDRLRIQADGGLKACLFEPAFLNLRPHLQSGDEAALALAIHETLWSKAWEHPPAVQLAQHDLPIMTGVGG